jgi:hypothetical protein
MVEPLAGTAIVRGVYPAARAIRRDIYAKVPAWGFMGWDRLPSVLDTSMLLNDILDAARGQGGSLLLTAVEKNVAHLYATEQVRAEVERRLEGRAIQGHVSPKRAFAVWRSRYLPAIRFVSVEVSRVGARLPR